MCKLLHFDKVYLFVFCFNNNFYYKFMYSVKYADRLYNNYIVLL